jgi:crotonobetainyl-CoA:carnitine CoA-transferase CaiB-like acyl-CoA transferase
VSSTLAGVRILDLTRVLAGPYGSMLLADMGAEVVKIEDPAGGDPVRRMGPPFVNGESAYFLALNRNKKSVALDLRSDAGRAAFLDLVARADVVLDNFRPGVMQRLGIGPDDCRQANERIITCSISAFGADGPYRDLPAFDLVLQALAGGMSVTGEPGRPPVRMGLPIGDLGGGLFASQAICAALYHRERTGRGQHIDLSLLDVQVSLLTYIGQYYLADGSVPGPIGSGHQTAVPYQAFATSDGHLVVAVFTDHFWEPFCQALDLLELAQAYPTNRARLDAREAVVAVIAARFAAGSTEAWVAALRQAGVPAGPVNGLDAVLADPQVRHRQMVTHLSRAHPVAGMLEVLGNPVKVGEPDRFEPAPLLGEHTADYVGGDTRGGT